MAIVSQLGLHKFRNEKFSISQIIFVLFSGLISLFILNTSINLTGNSILLLIFAISIFSIIYLIFHPKVWIFSIVLMTALFSSTSGGGISTIDVVFSIYFNVFIYLWLLWTIFIKKEKIIESKTDWLLLGFYVLTFLTLINVFYNYTLLFEWMREYSLLTIMLLYFPAKKYITTKKDIIILGLVFFGTVIACDIIQFYFYKQILEDITYAYEAGSTIRSNLYILVIGTTFSCLFIFYQKKTINRLILTGIMILTLGALASTFARIFWFAALINFIVIFLILEKKEKIRYISYLLVSIVVAYLLAVLFFGDILKFVIYALETKFETASSGTSDISALSRLAEWNVVVGKIKESPFIGYGFGATFTFKNPIVDFKNFSSVIHNSYLHFPFRIGIPLSLMFFSVFIINTFKSLYYSFKIKKDLFYKILMIGTFLSFFSLFLTGLFTMTFILRDALIINAMLFLLVHFVSTNYNKKVIN